MNNQQRSVHTTDEATPNSSLVHTLLVVAILVLATGVAVAASG